jgi:ferredoxin-NADP reductase
LEGAALLGRLTWRVAEVREIRPETSRVKTLVLDVPGWPGHRAGQHVDVRLTAEDGYEAQRSYSIASAPDSTHVELTVERLEDGEVSPYLTEELRPGDAIELRGPVGGYFVWDATLDGSAWLIAGGSGVVPLAAMARQRGADADPVPARLLYSARSRGDLIYREELEALASRDDGFAVVFTLTRERPPGWAGYTRRVDVDLLRETEPPELARVFVCGPTPFVEAVAAGVVSLGHDPGIVRTERFGPTGGRDG